MSGADNSEQPVLVVSTVTDCDGKLVGFNRIDKPRPDGLRTIYIVHATYDNSREIMAAVPSSLRALYLRKAFLEYDLCNMRWNGVSYDPGKRAISATIHTTQIKDDVQ